MTRFYYLICLLMLAACQREDSDVSESVDVIIEETETFFDSHFIGKATDVNGVALEGVQVSIGDVADYTTENGVFLFNNTKTNSTGALIQMTKNGYYHQYSFVPKAANQISNLHIPLRKKSDHQVFNSAEPNDLSVNNQISLTIPAEAFANTNGEVYKGQVRFYTDFAPVLGNMPVITKNFKKGILTNQTSMHFVFETAAGLPLQITKTLTLTVTASDVIIVGLDTKKAKWIETETAKKDNKIFALIAQDIPYSIGQFSPVTRINTQIVNEVLTGVSFTTLSIINEQQQTLTVHPDQDGYASFYLPVNSSVSIAVNDVCGNVLTESAITVGKEVMQQIPNIVLKNRDLLTVVSKIDACGLPLSDRDLVNMQLQSDGQSVVAYQSLNEQTFVMPICLQIAKASYFRGKDAQFSITFSGAADKQLLNINAMPLCIEKVSGYFSVNDVPVLLDMDEYYVYREATDLENVVISDLNGFMISIPKVVGKGQYKTDAIIFNHPKISDCLLESCSDITVFIDEISSPGAVVKIRIEGVMNGNRIKGEFVNLLRN